MVPAFAVSRETPSGATRGHGIRTPPSSRSFKEHVNLMEKPQIEAQTGPVPDDLVIKDLIVGEGAEAQPGGVVEVHYVGVDFETGEEFDSSWDRGQTNQFPLTGLIAGWQEGIPGMKVGGRRQLTIP